MWQEQPSRSSYRESIKALEADVQHANSLAAALPRDCGGEYLQMRLTYSPFAPFFVFLIEWIDCSFTTLPSYLGFLHIVIYKVYLDGMTSISSKESKATIKEFYAVIYPTLRQLEGELTELADKNEKGECPEISGRKRAEERWKLSNKDPEREDECGICMEACTKMVLPNCGHSMCISCFRDWNLRSQSCPFCRGSLKRVNSNDLWVLTGNGDVVDTVTLAKENLRHFYLYIDTLPLELGDALLATACRRTSWCL
ncbi:E3 ubiquitin-protein ligase AIRP2-like isoform X1 [Telopea speciosissima]|uniref:E3 ubiquitin-protein ligase AIRP2-like isoform X1 n=1 Tax=Telopea speciosissima TaxID=54955 RepID=UPI001CC5AB90|nr:E3 ubiquitin-protein ligase AIRP2-like isoform X1 [Telopea speciosissima]XP_043723996.1 E3 ubiquitin-protein ligase AIRP2-like isoform X1 [Telopea speciosissima]XP_043723997.1 E3 ubiquitin-protein ligase AIRP2-like isoform X1 [Telopea speciosissima]